MARTVLVPNLPTRWDAALKGRVPSIDLNGAAHHGELKCATQGPVDAAGIEAFLDAIHAAVDELEADDCILMTGDPVCQAAALSYACDRFKVFTVLRWDKQRRTYDKIEVQL